MPRKNYTLLNIATIGSLVIAALATANGLAVSPVKAATFQTLHSFAGGAEGAVPYGRMVFDAKTGLLYGTTVSEGAGNGGTVFQFNPSTQALTTLYSFTLGGKKGSNPQTPLILSKKGVLYGVTTSGGGSSACNFGCGTIFKLNLATKQLKTLYAFSDQSDGGTPEAGLVFDSAQSTVFGTTVQGGDFVDCQIGCGTVYKLVLGHEEFFIFARVPFDCGRRGGFDRRYGNRRQRYPVRHSVRRRVRTARALFMSSIRRLTTTRCYMASITMSTAMHPARTCC